MKNDSLDQLAEIRSMMERSSRFLSLSGLSGVLAGTYAIAGAFWLKYNPTTFDTTVDAIPMIVLQKYLVVAAMVVAASLLTGFYFTRKRAQKMGTHVMDKVAIRMLINLIIPIGAGGIFALILLSRGYIDLIAPTLLLFYGIGLINGSKYTFDDIRYLGMSEVVLGLLSAFDPGHGLTYWTIGFGVLHILYGSRMWWKYERNANA